MATNVIVADHGLHDPHAEQVGHGGDAGGPHTDHHVSSMTQLVTVFVTLLALTVLTVSVSQSLDLGYLSLFVALVVATVKAVLVMAYFMHLRYDRPFNAMLFGSGFLFLALFLAFALIDTSQYQEDVSSFASTDRSAKAEAAAKEAAAKLPPPAGGPPAAAPAPKH